MIRFLLKYNDKQYSVNDEGLFFIVSSEGEYITADLSKYVVSSFKDMIYLFEKTRKSHIEKQFYNFITTDENNEKYLVIVKQDISDVAKIYLVYKIENDEIERVLRLLLGNEDSAITFSTSKNYYNWIISCEILDVMLTYATLKSNNETIFAKRTKLKKNGKVRVYYAPHEEIKKSLRKLNGVLQKMYDKKNIDFQVAYKTGKSVYDNAAIHKDKKYVFNIDLKDFYPSCKRELVKRYISVFFIGAPLSDEASEEFLNMILINDGLFIGSPISGCLANTILNKPVRYMKNICNSHDMNFSVYADDMSFSSDKFISEQFVLGVFNEAFTEYKLDDYFKLNTDKSIGYTACNRKVTGVTINANNNVTVSSRYYRLLRAMICNLSKGDKSVNVKTLKGKISYAVMLDDSGKIYKYLTKFKDTVKKYSLCSDEKMTELAKKFA